MPAAEVYQKQVALLVKTIPIVASESCFALKGGTAINLFVRDLPRVSVDLDLTYLPVLERSQSLSAIDAALRRIAESIRARIPAVRVSHSVLAGEKFITKLVVKQHAAQSKSKSRRCCVAVFTCRLCGPYLPAWKQGSVSRKSRRSVWPTSSPARSLRLSTGSIREICSISEISLPTRASMMCYAKH